MPTESPDTRTQRVRSMSVVAKAWANGEPIPRKYTADGDNVSPPLDFGNVPEEAQVLAIIMDDPDAPRGTFTHWIAWNIPRRVPGLRENEDMSSLGAYEGRNDFGSEGYGGPSPPEGEEHRYYIHAYALKGPLPLREAVPREELERAMQGHVVAKGEYLGTYARRRP